jgi:hypothetical protein
MICESDRNYLSIVYSLVLHLSLILDFITIVKFILFHQIKEALGGFMHQVRSLWAFGFPLHRLAAMFNAIPTHLPDAMIRLATAAANLAAARRSAAAATGAGTPVPTVPVSMCFILL